MSRNFPTFLLLTAAVITTPSSAQIPMAPGKAEGLLPGSYPLPGSEILRAQEAELQEYLAAHPEVVESMKLHRATAWSFNVGDAKIWYADDLSVSPTTRYQVQSTCKAVGSHCYVFVEDSSWASGKITQAAVDSVRENFDARSPADPARGIYQIDVDTFGDPPDVDHDPKIIILILNIRDGYAGSGGFTAGYFYSYNEMTNLVQFPTSNVAEIYFLDCNPLDLNSVNGLRVGMATTAHEFQHMIHYNYDPSEITFINEMCSVSAEFVCGFPIFNQSYYAANANIYLYNWSGLGGTPVLKDYSRAARFGVYLRDQFGADLYKFIVASTQHGTSGLNSALASAGRTERFMDIFPRWETANITDDRTVPPVPWYGYLYPGLTRPSTIQYANPNVDTIIDTVQALAARFLSFSGGANLSITFNSASPSLMVNAVEIGSASTRVVAVAPGVAFTEPAFGSTYTTIHFVVMNTDPSAPAIYSYFASGSEGSTTVELKWDTMPAATYLLLGQGDTCCVAFDAFAGGRLDSLRVQLYGAGSITGGIWRNPITPPLGTRLAGPFTATNPTAGLNWVTLDLRTANIRTDQPFSVAFNDPGSSSNPHVVVSTFVHSGPYHSYTYLHGTPGPGWFYLNKNADTLWVYMVRAYLTVGTTDAQEVVLAPASCSLNQNYPNPFNPKTVISYEVAGAGDHGSGARNVKLTVYDLVGRRIAMLVDERKQPGRYTVEFDGSALSSGVYFYRLEAGEFIQTKKLILTR